MSYNPNQPYSNQPRRGPAGDANGIPYQTHSQYQQQNFAVPKANYNAPVNQLTDVRSMQSSQQYAPMTDNRGVVNGQTHSNPAISNPPANEWDQFFAQSGGADVQGNRGARSAYGAPQAQNRGANTQYAAPAATNYRMNNVYGGQQSEYDPSGLSSLKHTLAQTINSSAANVGGAYQHGDNNAYNPSAGAGAGAASKQHGYFGGNPAAVDAYGARPVGHPGQLPRTQQPYVAAHVASAATGSYNANSSVNLSRTTAAQGPAGLVPGDVRYQSANPQQFAPGVAAAHQQQQQGVRGGAGQYVQSSGFSAGMPLSAGAGGGAAGTVAPGGSYYNRRPEPTAGQQQQQQQQYNKRDFTALYDPSSSSSPAGGPALQQQHNNSNYSAPAAHGRVAASSFPAAQDPSYQQPPPLQHQQRARYQATGVPSFSPPHSPHQQPLTGGAALHLQQRLAYPPQQQQGPTARHYTPQVNPAAARSTYNPQLQLSGPAYAEPGAQNNGRVPNYDTRLSAGVVGDVSFNPVEVQYHPSAPRQSKWSAALVDPLDIYDNLLYNTVPSAAAERDMTLLQGGGGGGGDREGSHSQGRYGSRAVTAAGSASARGGGDPAGRYGDDTSSTSRYGPSSGPSGPNSGSKRARRSLSRSPPRLRGSVAAASSAGGGDHHHRSGAPQSRKSESSQRSRSRSRSGSVSMSDHRRGAGTGERGGGAFNPYGPVGGSGGGGGTAFRVSKPLLNYGTVPTAALIQHFQLPAFNVHGATQLREIDLCARFPQLYLPNDFLSVHLDHTAIHQALNEDIFSGLINSVPHVLESNPSALVPAAHPCRLTPASCDVLEPPKFTYCHTATVAAAGLGSNSCPISSNKAQLVRPSMPVKFQVKVLLCLGMSNAETDRIDHRLPQKLRFLCGRRKGNIMLLGCPWSAELDGQSEQGIDEQSPLHNRSVLVRTAQRALYSQCLLRIPLQTARDVSGNLVHSSAGLVRLSEVHYHRPQEVIKGRVYPEQEEITTLFLYTVQPHLLANALTAEEMERNYRVFCRRQQGTDVGPRVNEAVEHFEAEFSHTADRSDALLVPAFPAYTSATTGSDNAAVADSTPADARITSIDAVSATGVDTAVAVSDAAPVQAEQMHEVAEQEQSIVQDEGVTMTENDAEVPTTIEAAAASVTAPAESVTIADAHAPADSEAATANRDKDHAAGVTDIAAAAAKANSDSAPPAGTSAQVAVKLLPDRPERPTLLLCPMPLPEEVMGDAARKAEGVSLRLLPMSSVLDYTQEDRSERLFETSLAAELVRSLLSVNFANLVTDFIIAEHPVLHTAADARVINACRKLRAMIATDKAKVIGAGSTHTSNSSGNGKSSAPAMSVVAAEDSTTTANKEAAVVVEISDSATDATEDAVGARATSGAQASKDGDDDEEDVVMLVDYTIDCGPNSKAAPVTTACAATTTNGSADHSDAAAVAESTDEAAGAKQADADVNVNVDVDVDVGAQEVAVAEDAKEQTETELPQSAVSAQEQTNDAAGQVQVQVEAAEEEQKEEENGVATPPLLLMGEVEARMWRRRFVSAARWFDVSEDFFLQYEHLKMIINSSTRNLTRADVEDALDRVCKNDILRYETFI